MTLYVADELLDYHNMQSLWSLITYVNIPIGWSIPWLWVCHQPYAGWYAKSIATIYVCDHAVQIVADQTRFHETGHHLYESILTQQEKDEWEKLFVRHKRMWLSHFNREYSLTNSNECLADDIMTMWISWKRNKLQNIRIKTINKFLLNHNLTL